MTARGDSRRPPRLAEWLLRRLVGSGPRGSSILGDAREEMAARAGSAGAFRARLWYWGYVARFALTYRGGGGAADGGLGLSMGLRHAARSLARRPALSATVVATLTLGIGATTLAFAMVDGVLLRPLPYEAPNELVHVSRIDPDWFGGAPDAEGVGGIFATPPATFFDWEERARSFAHIGAYAGARGALQEGPEPVQITGAVVTSGVFAALAVPPLRGRYLTTEDDAVGAPPVLVLGEGLWMRNFGGDPDVLGRVVQVDGKAYTVVGIMPEAFAFPRGYTDFWMPFDDELKLHDGRKGGFLHAVARLAPEASVRSAREEVDRISARLAEVYPDERPFRTMVFPLQEVTVAGIRDRLLLLLAAASMVLLVGCANITSLFLSRVAERGREFAVHAALGAGSRRLAGLVLGESLLLAGLGGLLGTIFARVALPPFLAALPTVVPRSEEIGVDGRVALVAMALTLTLGVAVALVPAFRTGRTELNAALRDGGHGSSGSRSALRAQGLLIVGEVALAVLLLSASGLFLESYRLSAKLDRGFDPGDVVSARVSVPSLEGADGDQQRVFFGGLLDRARAIPGVTEVALASEMPLTGGYSAPPTTIETAEGPVEAAHHTSVVTPGYFEAMDIPLLQGRSLDENDGPGSAPVVVVSRSLAQRYWPGQDPHGRRIRLESGDDAPWREVVGVVGSVRYRFSGSEIVEYYRPFAQDPRERVMLVLETVPGVGGVREAAAQLLHDLVPGVPVSVQSLEQRAREATDYRWSRLASLVMTGLGMTATLLAVLGIYSVLSYSVVRRTRDIGIRVSLGGTRAEILRVVIGGFLALAGVGIALGTGLALATASAARTALMGVAPAGPWILVVVVALVLFTVFIASLVPAWRAVKIDPLVAFKTD